jgi:zinc protease
LKQPRCLALTLAPTLALALAAAAPAQVEDYRDLKFPPLAEFEIPRPQTFELENGLKVFLMEDHELPLIEVSARIRTGSVWEPVDKTGLAGITGTVQRTGGTVSMSGDEMDDFLEARAASVETSIGGTVGFASMDCLRQDFDEVLPLFVEVLRQPRFSPDKLQIAKAQAAAGVARRNDSVGSITSREFSRLMYGLESPLSRLTEFATLAAISRQDLVDWHARWYHPNNVYIGVVGDFEPQAMRRKLEAAFAGWAPGPPAETPAVEYAAKKGGVYFIEKTDVTQANIRFGHLGITVDNPDFFAIQVMNEVLSGGFSGRLMRNIRSNKGLAYGVGGGVGSSFLYPGVTGFTLQTKSGTMGEAVDALHEEIEGMIHRPASADEMARAKDSILNSFIFNYASRGQVLAQQMLYAYYGLPADFLELYRKNIEAVTQEDVARVAARYLHPAEAALLVVGNPADFDRPLASFGAVEKIDITIPPPPAP